MEEMIYQRLWLFDSWGQKIAATEEKELKLLTLKRMLQRLPIALAQVKAGNNSECLLN